MATRDDLKAIINRFVDYPVVADTSTIAAPPIPIQRRNIPRSRFSEALWMVDGAQLSARFKREGNRKAVV